MNDIIDTIAEYEKSCQILRGRVAELSARISGREPLREHESVKGLEARRYQLYCELAEMEEAICAMAEYAAPEPEQRYA